MSKKLKSQLLWIPILVTYLILPSPFGWYAMLALIVYHFLLNVVSLFIVKTVAPEEKHYEFNAFNECKTDTLDWTIYLATFTACMACKDYALAGGIVLLINAELEVFRITGQAS